MTTRADFDKAAAAIAKPASWEAEIAKPGEPAYRKTKAKPAPKAEAKADKSAGVSFDEAAAAIAMPASWEADIAKPGEPAYRKRTRTATATACVTHGTFACHDPSCRPPGSGGTGGSNPDGGAASKHPPVTIDPAASPAQRAEIQAGIDAVRAALPNAPHQELQKVEINTFSDQFATKSKNAIYIGTAFLDDDVIAKRAKDFGNSDVDNRGRLLTGTTRTNVIIHEYGHILDGMLRQNEKASAELNAFLNEETDYVDFAGNVTKQKRRDNTQHSASIYANENQFEYVAEGLTDAIEAGDNARPDSKLLLDIFRRGFDQPPPRPRRRRARAG